jgi:hypothetical protein
MAKGLLIVLGEPVGALDEAECNRWYSSPAVDGSPVRATRRLPVAAP